MNNGAWLQTRRELNRMRPCSRSLEDVLMKVASSGHDGRG